jgi:signal transduction histidine kinase
MKHIPPDPGVLPIFRLFAILWLVLFLLGGGILLVSEAFSHKAVLFYLTGTANAVLLLGYLFWPELPRHMGNRFLPIGVVIASVGPILVNHLTGLVRVQPVEMATSIKSWPLTAILFVPLVIIAWQHSLHGVGVFCIGTALLDLLLNLPTAGSNSLYLLSTAHVILTRTASLFLVGTMVARIMRIQRQQRQSLAEANAQLTHYATTLARLATTRERNRLARELHDTLAHTLSAVAVELEAVDSLWEVDSHRARIFLKRSLTTARTGLTETRRALQALRSSPLEDLGLALAIRQEAEAVAERSGFALDLQVPEGVGGLPPDVEQCVYRVAQEALANAARHAQPQIVAVSLLQKGDRLTLTISDDGGGFDLDAVDTDRHLGIQGMEERAEMVGGTLQVVSKPGEGTTIQLTVEETV